MTGVIFPLDIISSSEGNIFGPQLFLNSAHSIFVGRQIAHLVKMWIGRFRSGWMNESATALVDYLSTSSILNWKKRLGRVLYYSGNFVNNAQCLKSSMALLLCANVHYENQKKKIKSFIIKAS